MPRDARAYLQDIVDGCTSISGMVQGMDIVGYRQNRVIRRAVEREFTIIGEAVLALSRMDSAAFDAISQGRRIVDFRNQLTHAYASVIDDVVWGIAVRDVPTLLDECRSLLEDA